MLFLLLRALHGLCLIQIEHTRALLLLGMQPSALRVKQYLTDATSWLIGPGKHILL